MSKNTKNNTIITKDDVEHVAGLLMLKLTIEEVEKVLPNLQNVINNVEVLETIDTSTAEETHHVTGLKNILRKDEVKPSLSQKDALSNAADQEDSYFKVKGKLAGVEA